MTAIINWVGQLVALSYLGEGTYAVATDPYNFMYAAGKKVAPLIALIGLVFILMIASGLMLYSAMKMKRLESRRLSVATAILAMLIPPAFPIGCPVGLWTLVVLSDPDVRAAFGKTKRCSRKRAYFRGGLK